MAIAFIVGLYVVSRQARNDEKLRVRVYDLRVNSCSFFGLVGSKLLMVVTEMERFFVESKAVSFAGFLQIGWVFYGGFLGGLLAAVIFVKKWHLSWWNTLDAFRAGNSDRTYVWPYRLFFSRMLLG